MSLKFFFGPARCDHTTPLLAQAVEWLQKDKTHQVFYIVPNHVKFEAEVHVLDSIRKLNQQDNSQVLATMNLQVFSFTRLAWYFLQYTGLYNGKQLSDAGKHMVLRTILREDNEKLLVYRGEAEHSGFIQQLADFFQELHQGKITGEDLLLSAEQTEEADFARKLRDLSLIYQRYCQFLFENDINEMDILSYLAEDLQSKDLSHVQFILTGFTRLTAQEQELIEVIMARAGNLVVDLPLDQAYVNQPPKPYELFYDSGSLYYSLYHSAKKNGIPIELDERLPFEITDDLALLDIFWRDSQRVSRQKKELPTASQGNIKIWQAENPQAEVEHIAKEIRRLVSRGEYRYQDIEVLTRDAQLYNARIAPVFNAHDISFYLNEDLMITHHPLVEFLDALFAIDKRYYRYSDVMRFLRTELFLPGMDGQLSIEEWLAVRDDYREKVDQTDNVVLAYGYEGINWVREKDWEYVTYIQESSNDEESLDTMAERISNEVRRDIRDNLVPFFQKLKQAKTGREGAYTLYQFLVDTGVEQQLLYWRDYYIQQGELEEAKIHEQTWQAFVALLDEYVEILGNRSFDLAEFEEILAYGLEGMTYSKVPTTLDQVKVSILDKVHAKKNKVTFILGATDQVLPGKTENTTLLSDEERQDMTEVLQEEQYLLPTGSQSMHQEPNLAYLAFLSTSEKLYLTYPMSGEKGSVGRISPYVARIAEGLKIPIEEKYFMPSIEIFEESFVGNYRTLVGTLIHLKRQSIDEDKEIPHQWGQLEKSLFDHGDDQSIRLAHSVFRSLNKKNIPEKLAPELVSKLYGDTLYGSVSKIERFYQCEYKYFLTYGLRLKEREVFELTPAAAGEFFHDTLDAMFKVLIENKLSLSQLNEDELNKIADQVLTEVLDYNKFMILTTSNRMNYIRYQLIQTIKRVSWALREQSNRTGLSTAQTEVIFGEIAREKGLKSLEIPLSHQREMKIRGKIDRVDVLMTDEEPFISVVDYKSSAHKFSFQDAYFGLAMQMITYLDVAMMNAASLVGTKEAKLGGAFYLHIKNPRLKEGIPENQLFESMLKEFRYQGLLVEDDGFIEQLDKTVGPQETSAVYPYNILKNGTVRSNQFVTEDELELLRTHNRELFSKAGENIYSGNIRLNPAYREKIRIACQYCPFRSVCQFDPMLKENNYHRLEKMKKDDVIDRIKFNLKGEVEE